MRIRTVKSSGPNRKIRRVGRGRSRTGCANCKDRHVKCDEARPSCTQCQSSGHGCSGYDFSSSRLKVKLWTPQPTGSVYRSPKESFGGCQPSSIQRYYFELFRQQLATKCSSKFNATLWTITMLQASHMEASILNILVAISASVGRELVPIPDQSPSSSAFYGVAVSETRRLLSRERPSLQTIVLCCIGLATLEVLRCQHSAALMHLESCIKLIGANSSVTEPIYQVLDRDVLQGLIDFDHHASQFLAGRPPLLLIDTRSLREMNHPPSNAIADSFKFLDMLSRRLLRFTRTKADKCRAEYLGHVPLEVHAELQNILTSLSIWSAECSHMLSEISVGNDEEASFKSKLLLMQHALMVLEASTSLSIEETSYDKFGLEFVRIVTLAFEASISSFFSTTFSTDVFGVVKPLFVTALKCRDLELRSRALNFLISTPRQEGVWASTVMGSVAKAVIDLEESYRISYGNWSHIPEHRRVHSVVSAIDNTNKTATVECTLRPNGMDGEWETRTIPVNWAAVM